MYIIVTENTEALEILRRNNISAKIIKVDNREPEVEKNISSDLSSISDFLIGLGIRPYIKGFHYLEYTFENKVEYPGGVTKELYPYLAKVFNSTPQRIERAIRHAIETAKYDRNTYTKLFGDFRKHPTNLQFIEGCKIYLKKNPIV